MPNSICTECGQLVQDLSASQVGELLKKYKVLWLWEDHSVGYTAEVPGLGKVELVHNSYLGNDEGSIKMVWSTKHGSVGVSGYYSSYSGSNWSDEFLPAEKKTREVVYYE